MLAAIGVCVVFLRLIRVLGQRPLERLGTADTVVVLALGSVIVRVVLGTSVGLSAGGGALVTLLLLRLVAERVGRTQWGRFLVRDRPVALMAAGTVHADLLARVRVSRAELTEALRTAGVEDGGEVACIVLEWTAPSASSAVGSSWPTRATPGSTERAGPGRVGYTMRSSGAKRQS